MAVGITQVGKLVGDYYRTRNVEGSATVRMVSAVIVGPRAQIAACMRQIRVGCTTRR
jgi:hypothetical protein